MSKPVTNVEIEDVLSSIRRLVTNSDRSERSDEEAAPEVSEKLVLTPSLRVDDDHSQENRAEEIVEDQAIDVEPTVELDEDSAVNRGPEDACVVEDENTSEDAVLDAVAETLPEDEMTVETADNQSDAPENDVLPPLTLDDALDELIAENTDNSSDFEALDDFGDAEPAETSDVLPEKAEDAQEAAEDVELADASDRSIDVDDTVEAGRADQEASDGDGNTLVRRAAEFEEIIALKDDAWDPDDTSDDANTPSSVGPLPWDSQDDEVDPTLSDDGIDDTTNSSDALETSFDAADPDSDDDLSPMVDAAATDGEPLVHDSKSSEPENDLARVMAEVARKETEAVDAEEVEAEAPEAAPVSVQAMSLKEIVTDTVEDMSDDISDDIAEEAMAELTAPDTPPFVFRSQAGSRTEADHSFEYAPNDDDAGKASRLTPEEALLDEETLRDMVSEIVRQELQGALGERITRNVRKLVRREIHRALASQDLE